MNFIAQGALTMSKHKDQWPDGTPLAKGHTQHDHRIYTENGSLIDYTCALGANLIDIRNSYSLPTRAEESLAFRLTELFPCIEKVKILKTGTDACNAAVRIARAYHDNKGNISGSRGTGIGTGYHGWGNSFIASETPGTGTMFEGYKKLDDLTQIIETLEKCEGVFYCIIEPVVLDLNVKDQLLTIRRLCSEKGIVLIFDEIITGFRFPNFCVSNFFGVQPDIICLGKALGNGYPISVVGGRRDIMETPGYFISGTFFGESSSITNALDTLDYLTEKKLSDLWDSGGWIIDRFNAISPLLQMQGYPTRCVWKGEPLLIAIFCQQMQKRGFLLHPRVWFITFAHTEKVNTKFIEQSRECINDILTNNIQLIGNLPKGFKR